MTEKSVSSEKKSSVSAEKSETVEMSYEKEKFVSSGNSKSERVDNKQNQKILEEVKAIQKKVEDVAERAEKASEKVQESTALVQENTRLAQEAAEQAKAANENAQAAASAIEKEREIQMEKLAKENERLIKENERLAKKEEIELAKQKAIAEKEKAKQAKLQVRDEEKARKLAEKKESENQKRLAKEKSVAEESSSSRALNPSKSTQSATQTLSFAEKPNMAVKFATGWQQRGSLSSYDLSNAIDEVGYLQPSFLKDQFWLSEVGPGAILGNYGIIDFSPTFEIFLLENNKNFSVQSTVDVNFSKLKINKSTAKKAYDICYSDDYKNFEAFYEGELLSEIESWQDAGFFPKFYYDIAVELLLTYHFYFDKKVSAYIALGPAFDFFMTVYKTKTEKTTVTTQTITENYSYSMLAFSVGVSALLGISYEIINNLFIDLEYHCKITTDFDWGFRVAVEYRFGK